MKEANAMNKCLWTIFALGMLSVSACTAHPAAEHVAHKSGMRARDWCEIFHESEQYDGKIIRVRMHFVVTLHGDYYVYDPRCPKSYVGMRFANGKAPPGFDDRVINKSIANRARGGRADFTVEIDGIFRAASKKGVPILSVLTIRFMK
jgi:hypothetical protein